MSEAPVETPTAAPAETPTPATEHVVDPDEFTVLKVDEEFREAPSEHTNVCSGPGEENNADIWTQ